MTGTKNIAEATQRKQKPQFWQMMFCAKIALQCHSTTALNLWFSYFDYYSIEVNRQHGLYYI